MNGQELYAAIVSAGIEHGNHESDLYIPVNPQTQELIKQYEYRSNITSFKNQIDGKRWFDVPFCFIPFWKHRTNPKKATNA